MKYQKETKSLFTAPMLIVGALLIFMGYLLGAWHNGAFNTPQGGISITKITAETNQSELRNSAPSAAIKRKGQNAEYQITLPTPHYGNIGITGAIDLRPLQYKHAVGIGVAIINTEALLRLSYQFKQWDFSLYGGYDLFKGSYRFGAGFGYYWRF